VPHPFLSTIARVADVPSGVADDVQRHLAGVDVGSLVQSSHLTTTVWVELYHSYTDARIRDWLCARPLPEPLRRLVVATEKRARVLTTFSVHNPLDDADATAIVSRRNIPAALAGAVLDGPTGTVDEQLACVAAAPSKMALRWLAYGGVDHPGAAALVATVLGNGAMFAGKRSATARRLLSGLLDRNRELLDVAVELPSTLTVVSALPGLPVEVQHRVVDVALGTDTDTRDYALRALAAAPGTSAEVRDRLEALGSVVAYDIGEQVRRRRAYGRPAVTDLVSTADDKLLAWLYPRAMGSQSNPFGRPLEAAALGRNPHLSADQAVRCAEVVCSQAGRAVFGPYRDGVLDEITATHPNVSLFRDELERHGTERDNTDTSPCTPMLYSRVSMDRVPDYLGEMPVTDLYGTAHAVWFLERATNLLSGSDPTPWLVMLGLLADFDGTVDELLDVATLL
jgi:hypothetical protein